MNKPWLESYGKNMPHEIDADACSSVVSLFKEAVASYGDLPAFECFGKTMTYNEVDRAATAVGAWLQQKQGENTAESIMRTPGNAPDSTSVQS